MFELGLGVILAALFVAAYLIITNFLRRDRPELEGLYPRVTLNPMDTTHTIGAGKSRRVLTSGKAEDQQSDRAMQAEHDKGR